jgi:hypothetical protein
LVQKEEIFGIAAGDLRAGDLSTGGMTAAGTFDRVVCVAPDFRGRPESKQVSRASKAAERAHL